MIPLMILNRKLCLATNRARSFTRMALGSHKHVRIEPGMYGLIVNEAINQGITVIESGQDDGVKKLAEALSGYNGKPKLSLLNRLGYQVSRDPIKSFSDTIVLEKVTLEGGSEQTAQFIHTLNGASVENFLKQSPLMDLKQENVQVIPMIHNPEVHREDTLSRLTDAFCSLEEAVRQEKIPSFGVVSNGLSLPPEHPLHLDWKSTVLKAACDAAKQTSTTSSNLSILQLAANILETRGLQVAKDVTSYIKENFTRLPILPDALQIYIMRPLTCYPDQGTGDGFGFQLIDYPLPTEPGVTEWTHEMKSAPPVYHAILKKTLSYFDANEILERKQKQKLSEEEEQTLIGAKILSDMIQELNKRLEEAQSFTQHEIDLMSIVMPVLEGTFEEVDEETSKILQDFFAAYGLAARYHIAQKTRSLLAEGGEGVNPYKIPSDMKMQQFAIEQLLQEKIISKIIVGGTKPEHVRDTMEIFREKNS
mmetsp:Transcript_16623/g.19159  ORF Transcript_16623/g.19159 Transcript_16623/m.19159 type:complete len:478 (-) Transcript_16623:203-1636(-)|eukprot:CAMPEP_0194146774 /NCGR_PEP_ID=MMETSP0152-20130528/21655_1 /TAXON_ID=1049557 /ORGANISM="Thalassiothrix antarctica, Strain L6-D1" /LENGTH=477 /DNA_ID=CAMNT_0038847369 /DNA_START=35 /DNA_END=1468 /DNA_ORIENTATION=+